MRFKRFILLATGLSLLVSCSDRGPGALDGKTVISIQDFKEVRVDTPFEMFEVEPRFVRMASDTCNSYGFSKVYKAEYIDGKIYILEQRRYRLLVFDDTGRPVFKLDYRGRGPNEFLQITDFAVDRNGDLWIADAQKDRLFKYSLEGDLLDSRPFDSEIVRMCGADPGQFMVGIANYDSSEYAGTALAIADSTGTIRKPVLPYPDRTDPNFWFTSIISRGENGVFYNWPVDDNLYEISYDGEVLNTFYFDFGNKAVPLKWRNRLERHEAELPEYRFLARSFKVTPGYVLCGISNSIDWYSVILDRKKKIAMTASRALP